MKGLMILNGCGFLLVAGLQVGLRPKDAPVMPVVESGDEGNTERAVMEQRKAVKEHRKAVMDEGLARISQEVEKMAELERKALDINEKISKELGSGLEKPVSFYLESSQKSAEKSRAEIQRALVEIKRLLQLQMEISTVE